MVPIISKMLQALRAHPGFLSGQKLARDLGISRAALWKQIQTLRDHGYIIEAHRAKGYRLLSSPDRPYPWEIILRMRTGLFSRTIIYRDECSSTNVLAGQLGGKGAAEGTVVIAECQTGGKGRLGRVWHSPPGLNIYTSSILRPSWPPARGSSLTLAAGVAVAQTLEDLYGLRPTIKWPNDVLLNGKKAAGILSEMNSEQDRINFIVLGIGLNVNGGRGDFPASLRDTAVSLKEVLGKPVSRTECTAALYDHLDECYTLLKKYSLAGIKDRWESRSALSGKRVQAVGSTGAVIGQAVGLDDDGSLLIRVEGEGVKKIIAGDVTLCSLS